jgi:hypothetical protein
MLEPAYGGRRIPIVQLLEKLDKIAFLLTALSGKMMVFGYLETANPRH